MNRYSNGKGRRATAVQFQSAYDIHPKQADVWRMPEVTNAYSNPEFESEWETQEAAHYDYSTMAGEAEAEAQFFLQRALQGIRRVAQATAPIARQVGSIAAKMLINSTPGAGRIAGPRASRLIKTLLWEGEMEAAYLEAQWFGFSPADMEIAHNPSAYDAALSEVLAAEASHTHSEGEAAALIGAMLPVTIRIMGGRRMVRPITPVLLAATVRLVRLLHQRGPAGRRLLRLVPAILRRTIVSLQTARRLGHPLSSALVGRVMAAHTARVFGNPQLVGQLIARNAVIRQRTVSVG